MIILKLFTKLQVQETLRKENTLGVTVAPLIMSPNPRGDTAMRWIITLGVIDTLAVVVRFLVRKKNGTKIAGDDWVIMASLVPAYCMIASAILGELLSSRCF